MKVQPMTIRQIERRQFVNPRLCELAIDAKKYPKDAINYVNMFLSIYDLRDAGYARYEEIPKFYIRDVVEALNTLGRKERKALERFFGIGGGVQHYLKEVKENDVALINMVVAANEAADRIKSIDTMYAYNKLFREAVDNIAKKVRDPENKYTNLQKAKVAHLYFWFIRDFQFMPYDSSRMDEVMLDIERQKEIEQFPTLAAYMAEWKAFYFNVPDGDLIIPQVLEFVWQADADLDTLMTEFSAFTNDMHLKGHDGDLDGHFKRVHCNSIRASKERLFAAGEWNCDYMRLSKFAEMSVEQVEGLIRAYNFYKVKLGYEFESCRRKTTKEVMFRTKGLTQITYPVLDKEITFVDEFEMIYFLDLIEYVVKYEPDFEFHGKPFKSYGFLEKVA